MSMLRVSIAAAFAALTVSAPVSEALGCVYVTPLPEEVHAVIRQQGVQSLRRWILWDRAALDVIDPRSGRTPLMTAMVAGRPGHFRFLLDSGAQPNLTDGQGNSALHVAALINEPWHILALLKAGADPALRNAEGQTFQHYLFLPPADLLSVDKRKGLSAVVEWLTVHGVAIEAQSAV